MQRLLEFYHCLPTEFNLFAGKNDNTGKFCYTIDYRLLIIPPF
jgi:hypothetical protein